MHFYEHERLGLFIDGANLHATARALEIDIDYRRLLEFFGAKGRLVRALYYTTIAEGQEFCSLRPLVDWLDYNGYTLVTKPIKELADGRGRRGSIEVELAVDALSLAATLDHIILLSGHGHFRSLVAALQQMGRRVSVVSTIQSHPPMVADELRRQADQFVDLADLEAIIGRDTGARTGRSRGTFAET